MIVPIFHIILCFYLATPIALAAIRHMEYARAVIVSPAHTSQVGSWLECLSICREEQPACSAFTTKPTSLSSGALECSIATGEFNFTEDAETSLYLDDMGLGYKLLADGWLYKYVGTPGLYDASSAANMCYTEGGNLPVPYPKERMDMINAHFPTDKFIGIISNIKVSGEWITDDGTKFNTSQSDPNQPWAAGQPDNTGLVCLLELNGTWVDTPCSNFSIPTQVLCRFRERYIRSPVNGKYYKFHYSRTTPAKAAQICESEGGTLANMYNRTNWAATAGYRARVDRFNPSFKWGLVFFIAGTDKEVEGIWKMPDGTWFNVSNRANDPDQYWETNEPNNGAGGNNLIYVPRGGFGDFSDLGNKNFLCEKVL